MTDAPRSRRRQDVRPRTTALVIILLTLSLAGAPARGDESDPVKSVLMLVTLVTEGASYRPLSHATGFFISSGGRALTNSHVVYTAQHDPAHTLLLAVVGKEFYRAAIVCASPLGFNPSRPAPEFVGVPPGRDVAEVQVAPSDLPFDTYDLPLPGGIRYTLATAHTGPLPVFTALLLGDAPRRGEHVRIVGYGHISPIPRVWTATGLVSDVGIAADATPIFSLVFTNPAQPGNSGSPVLNEQGRVMGIFAWYDPTDPTAGAGISSTALTPACR